MTVPDRSIRRLRWRATLVVAVAAVLAGCAGAPPAGTAEYAAWVRQKQEQSAALERAGCDCGASWFRNEPIR